MTDEILHAGEERAGAKEIEDAEKVRITGGVSAEKQIALALFLARAKQPHLRQTDPRQRRLEALRAGQHAARPVHAAPRTEGVTDARRFVPWARPAHGVRKSCGGRSNLRSPRAARNRKIGPGVFLPGWAGLTCESRDHHRRYRGDGRLLERECGSPALNQDWALKRPGYDPEPYLSALDFVIDAAASHGAYTLLDLQWLDAVTPRGANSDGSANFVPPLPNLLSLELWPELAARYAAEPAVLYDIFNEPHDALPDDEVPLLGMGSDGATSPLTSRRVTMAEWQPWALQLIAAIRGQNPAALIFVPGTNWAYDLRGFPLPVDGLVYSTHVYRNKGRNWDEAFGCLSQTHPVFAGEWGGGAEDIQWGLDLIAYFQQHHIGWTAWSWSDYPHLLDAPVTAGYRPTLFGRVVRDALSA